ncbi:DUF1570 domain-containing protein [Thalassoroseus pseudoceratinae]|uniref:DUF1570 domain-containing protein n=1 Tax=Thalassoroseus pseudoceratinae TaxID=2713176 RepID=UPI001420664E|nr:DUF1570 domain-containing protein [Thalassoroseus pseudoceratinae]
MNSSFARISLFLLVVGFATPSIPAADSLVMRKLDTIRSQHQRLQEELRTELATIIPKVEADGDTEVAAEIRRLMRPIESSQLQFSKLPTEVAPKISRNLPDDEQAWRRELHATREKFGDSMYRLSRTALHAGFPSYAYRLVRETANIFPDHSQARRLLGYVRVEDRWVTPFAAKMARERRVWHDTFGWLRADEVDRYENGERFYRRWMPAAQEAEIRQDFRHAWEVRTEHFLIKTNHSLESGVEIATKLEEFYEFFQQTFVGYFYSPDQLKKLFTNSSGGRAPRSRDPFVVHFYKSREEYIDRLKARTPQIAITTGFYHYGDRVAYFYHDEKADDSVIYHEATHQFLYETLPTLRHVGQQAHFWITEGIACYMESYENQNGQISLGDPDYIRFAAARYRFFVDDYYVPFDEYSAMGMREFQSIPQPQIGWNYSQASGLAHFFMHYQGGRYRDALVEHLSQLYHFNPRRLKPPATLPQLIGIGPKVLDAQYAEHLKNLERERR